MSTFWLLISILAFGFLSGCSSVGSISEPTVDSGPDRDVDVSHVKDAIPQYEPIKKAGNTSPYKVLGKTYRVNFSPQGFSQKGKASWYGKKFHGNKTANGETYDMYAMTAAHKTLPIPSYVQVTNLDNNRSVVVRVNDRGPFHGDRIIDLSYAAAKKLDIYHSGTGSVRVDLIVPPHDPNMRKQKPSTTNHYLQIGAFRRLAGAEELQQRISSLTPHKVVITAADKNKFYKVLIGPILQQMDLDALKDLLSTEKLINAHLITLE